VRDSNCNTLELASSPELPSLRADAGWDDLGGEQDFKQERRNN